jgi:hypothetical protein
MDVVPAALYAGSGVRSSPRARGENSGEGERSGSIFFCKLLGADDKTSVVLFNYRYEWTGKHR